MAMPPMPGDELCARPALLDGTVHRDCRLTRGHLALASATRLRRGGFCNYAGLENFADAGIVNTDRIHLEFQLRAIGDEAAIHRKLGRFRVVQIDPPSTLVLLGAGSPLLGTSWALTLEATGAGATRLPTRMRIDRGSRGARAAFVQRLFLRALMTPGHGFMERGILRGIRARAEGRLGQ